MFFSAIDYIGGVLMGRDAYRRGHYKLAKKIAARQDFEVYKPHLIWQADEDYIAAREIARARGIEGLPHDRGYILLEAARLVRDIDGHFAECGVRYGKSSVFLLTGAGKDSSKCLHIFDSFAGLSDPDGRDVQESGVAEWEQGDLAVPEDIVRRNLAEFGDRVILHKGWIPERFSEVETDRFSFVHVDVDLFEPTLATAEFFYPRLNPGGFMICDDYGSAYCPGAKKAIDTFFADKPEHVISLPTGQAMVIKL